MHAYSFMYFVDEPPEVISDPESLKDISPTKTVEFTTQATGTEPMHYNWEWKPAVDGDGNEEWQPCNTEMFSGTESSTLVIYNVQKLNEGSYRSVISNYAGSKTSQPSSRGEPACISNCSCTNLHYTNG